MRAVIQRVRSATACVEGEVVGEIGAGLLVFLGVAQDDGPEDVRWLADKIIRLRIFEAADGKIGESLATSPDLRMLVISQFTLLGSLKKGTRPSFHRAAAPALAEALYEAFLSEIKDREGRLPACGRFGADMRISAENDGPVTIIIDSKDRDF